MARLTLVVEACGSLVAVLIVWASLTHGGALSEFLLPAPDAVLARIAADWQSGDLPTSLSTTLENALIGFGMAGAVGTLIGILMARVKLVHWFFDPLVSLGFPMPKIAFLPVFLLWLGPTDTARITIVAVSAIFPVIVAAQAGADGVEKTLIWSAISLGASRRAVLWEIVLPAIVPTLFTGLQIALPVALVTTIVAEMLTGADGIGGAMLGAMRFADSPGVFAGIVVIALTGLVVIRAMEALRGYLLRWHPEGQSS
ncbi:MAG: ABC transporter permease [Acetobacteraceae bacterium]|nr:ABC transporter permease [Acetobacteraceae bacterium]